MKTDISRLTAEVIKNLYSLDYTVDILKGDSRYGDYSSNVALKLSSQLNQPPLEIASELAKEIKAVGENSLKDVTVSAPGFINFTLRDSSLLSLNYLNYKVLDSNIVIETNNPNPFKAMHIGHALNAVVGDTIANILELGGAKVHRVSYHGDVGSHVGKSMWAILKFIDGDIEKLNKIPPSDHNNFMSEMYAKGAKAYEEDEEAKTEIIELTNKSYELEDNLFRQTYSICKDWSFSHLETILNQLGSKPVEKQYLESECEPIGVKIVTDNLNKYFFESNGAIVFKGEDYGLFTTVFIASSGKGLYAARDLGLIELKKRDFSPDKILIVTANEQKDYFKVIIKASNLVGLLKNDEMENINTGIIKLTSGKMSSRQGQIVEISWLIDRVREEFKKFSDNLDDKLVAGAIRYQLLKVRLGSDIVFDIAQSVSLQGNSGPYLMYAHARARSILSKAGYYDESIDFEFEGKERELAVKLAEYESVLVSAVDELRPHYICNYLYELCQTFNSFYEDSPVLNSDRKDLRLNLVSHYSQILKHGLGILGIYAPDKM